MLAAIIVLAIMILPTVINMSVSAIRAVPSSLKQASLALGATKMQTIFKAILPAAKSGIVAGIVLGIGAVFMVIMAKIDYHQWKKFYILAYLGSLVLCTLVLLPIPGLTRSSHGKSRWLNLGPVSFQPSELAKLAIIIFLAVLIERHTREISKTAGVIKVFVYLAPPI